MVKHNFYEKVVFFSMNNVQRQRIIWEKSSVVRYITTNVLNVLLVLLCFSKTMKFISSYVMTYFFSTFDKNSVYCSLSYVELSFLGRKASFCLSRVSDMYPCTSYPSRSYGDFEEEWIKLGEESYVGIFESG